MCLKNEEDDEAVSDLGSRSDKAIDYTVRKHYTYSIRLHNYPHEKCGLVTCINPLSHIKSYDSYSSHIRYHVTSAQCIYYYKQIRH